MKKIRIFIMGADGKMGNELVKKIKREKYFQRVNAISNADVAIDFSSPRGALEVLAGCLKNKVPLVTGTTGFQKNEMKKLKQGAHKIPVLWSANMSPGINLLFSIIEGVAKNFRGEVEINEIHHKKKKDNPSGTARTFKDLIEQSNPKLKVYLPKGKRKADVFGIHEIKFKNKNEAIVFKHEAQNREMFAQGALEAAKWIVSKRPGLYSSRDVYADVRKKTL